MASVRESKAFLLKKAKILDAHVATEKQLRDSFASRGFSAIPGQFHEQMIALELDTKDKLDQANFEVLQQSLERRMTALGLELDKEALDKRMAFEVRKSQLFTTMANEFADLRKSRALDKDSWDAVAVELSLREVALLYAEADIAAEIETLKQQQVDAESLSLDKEVALAEGKLGLANERLALIPSIRLVIAEQRKVIDYERDTTIPLTETLMAEKQTLIDLQTSELIPAMAMLNSAIKRWAEARPDVVSAQMDKAQAVLNLASREESLTVLLLAAARAKLDYAESLQDLLPLRGEVASAEINHALNLVLQANADLSLANAEKDLAEEQSKRITPLQNKAAALGRYAIKQGDVAAAMLVDVSYRMRSADAKILAATYRIAAMDSEIGALLADVSSERAKSRIDIVRSQLNLIENQSESSRVAAEVSGLSRVATAKEQHVIFKEAKVSEVTASQESRVRTEISERLRWRIATAMTKINAEADYHHEFGQSAYHQHIDIAQISAMKTVTSSLVHTLA